MVGGCKGIFYKGVGEESSEHRADERILRYKLETYQKNFPNFICGSPTSIEVLSQDEEIKAGPGGTTQEQEVQIEESQDLRIRAAQEEEVQLELPLEEGSGRKKSEEKVEAIPTPEEEISKIQHLQIKPQIELVGEEIRIAKQNVNTQPLVFVQIGITTL